MRFQRNWLNFSTTEINLLANGILLVLFQRGGSSVEFVLGIDGGGTSCRAALAAADGTVLARARSGAANIRTDLTGARANIADAARQAFLAAGIDPVLMPRTPAVLGLAGANVGTYRQQLAAILPFAESRVETDAEIALEGAVGSGDGAIAILGTGTAYMVRRGGVSARRRPAGASRSATRAAARASGAPSEQTLLAYDGIREGRR